MSPRRFAPRLTAPRCRGGASSVLRLSPAMPGRWPSAAELSEWAGRLAKAGTVVLAPADPSPPFTHLSPRAA